jgi:hypothetical protein
MATYWTNGPSEQSFQRWPLPVNWNSDTGVKLGRARKQEQASNLIFFHACYWFDIAITLQEVRMGNVCRKRQ